MTENTGLDLRAAIRAANAQAAKDTEYVQEWGHDGIYAGSVPAIVQAAAALIAAQVRAQIAADIEAERDAEAKRDLTEYSSGKCNGLDRAARIARGES